MISAPPVVFSPELAHIESWVFDLDNTLYHPRCRLFDQVDQRMEQFIATVLGVDRAEARRVQKRYFIDHGATLHGLIHHHGVDPHDFLTFVHDIDLSLLIPDAALIAALQRLPGRRFIYTNGDHAYSRRVLTQLGLAPLFPDIHDIIAANYAPKPQPGGYQQLIDRHGINPHRALFVEDMARNLTPAKALGMTTLWYNNGSESGDWQAHAASIDYQTDDLVQWLTQALGPVKG